MGAFDDLIPGKAANPFADLIPQGPMSDPDIPMPGADVNVVQPDNRSFLERKARALQVGAQGVGEGVAGVAGFPGDMLQMAGDALRSGTSLAVDTVGFPETAASIYESQGAPLLPTSDMISGAAGDAIRSVFGDDALISEEQMSPSERIAKTINQFGTEAAVGSGAAIRGAPGLANRATRAAADAGTAGKTFVGDAAAGAGAGLAVGSAEESPMITALKKVATDMMGPTGGAVVDTLIPMIGGTAGGATAGGAGQIVKTTRGGEPVAAIDPSTGEPFSRTTADLAAEFTQNELQARQPTAQILQERAEEFANAGVSQDATPTVGMLVGAENPAVAQMDRTARVQNPVPFLKRDQARGELARETIDGIAPQGDGRALTDAVAKTADARRTEAQSGVDAAQAVQTQFAQQQLAEGQQIEALGGGGPEAAKQIDEIVTSELTAAQAKKNQAFAAIDPDGVAEVSPDNLKQAIENIEGQLGALNDPNAVLPNGVMDRIRNAESLTVKDLTAVQPELASAKAAARASQQFKLADNIGAIQKAIAGEIENLASRGDDVGQRAAEANRVFKDEFAPVFKRGPQDEANRFRQDFNQDRTSRTTTPPSQTAGRFIRAGQPEKAQALTRIMSQSADPAAGRKAAGEFLADDLVGAGIVNPKTGEINRVKAGKWLQKWGEDTIEAVAPGMAAEVRAVMSAAETNAAKAKQLGQELIDAQNRQKMTEQDLAKGALSFALDASPEKAIAGVLASKDPQRNMAKLAAEVADDPQALVGLKQSVREYLLDNSTNAETGLLRGEDGAVRPVSPAKISDLMEKHRGVLSEVFDEKEMNALQQVHTLLKDERIVKSVMAIQGSPTKPLDEAIGRARGTLEAAVKLKFGMLRGGGIMRAMRQLTDATVGEGTRPKVERLLQQAMLDPELAAHLMVRNVTDAQAPAWNKRLVTLMALQEGSSEE